MVSFLLTALLAANAYATNDLPQKSLSLEDAEPTLDQTFKDDPAIRIGEDYMLMAESLACGARCAVEPSAGYLYTRRAGSVSHRLTMADIERIAEGDKKFLAKYNLGPAAFKAQKARTARLADAAAFTKFIDALKHKNFRAACLQMAERPIVLWHLHRPFLSRIGKMVSQ